MKTLFDRLIQLSPLSSPALLLPILIALAPQVASAQAVPAYLDRVTQIIYDFDANQTPDATDVISYDTRGRPESAAYTSTQATEPKIS